MDDSQDPIRAPGGEPANPPDDLRQRLERDRDAEQVRRDDFLARRTNEVSHEIAVGDVTEQKKVARYDRERRAVSRREVGKLIALVQQAMVAGTAARLKAEVHGSGEMRALRLARLQTVVLLAGIPVLLAFGAWSTTGVQAGVARWLELTPWSPGWIAAWLVEPAIITVVAGIIIVKAILRTSGGDVDYRATLIKWGSLLVSLLLNGIGTGQRSFGVLVAHSIGPLGTAVTAFLVGLLIEYITRANPWKGAPRIAQLRLNVPKEFHHLVKQFGQSSTQPTIGDGQPTQPPSVEQRPGLAALQAPQTHDSAPPVESVPSLVPDRIPDWMVPTTIEPDTVHGGGVGTLEWPVTGAHDNAYDSTATSEHERSETPDASAREQRGGERLRALGNALGNGLRALGKRENERENERSETRSESSKTSARDDAPERSQTRSPKRSTKRSASTKPSSRATTRERHRDTRDWWASQVANGNEPGTDEIAKRLQVAKSRARAVIADWRKAAN